MGLVTLASLGPLGEELGAGGQGTVYALPRSPSLVYKAYSGDARADLDAAVLTDMIGLPAGLSERDRRDLLAAAAWPRDTVTDDGRVSGFTMPLVPGRFHTTLKLPDGQRQNRLGQTQLLLNRSDYLDRVDIRVDDRFRLDLLADIAGTLRLFHRLGLTVGDLSPNNLLFSRAGKPLCHFIDCDAMQLNGRTVLPQVETTDWEALSEDGAMAAKDSDVYKFVLLCVRLFAGDQSTTDAAALRRAGTGVHALAVQGLSGPVPRRPDLAKWEKQLRAARGALGEPVAPPAPKPSRPRVTPKAPPVHAPVAVRPPWFNRRRRRRLAKFAVVACLLGYGVTHTQQIESWLGQVAEAVAADDQAQAQAQADGIAALLNSSAPVRTKVKTAIGNLAKCRSLKKSVSDLGAAAEARQRSYAAANVLVVTDVDDGAEMKGRLVEAFRHSKAADDAYRGWGQKLIKKGCGKSVLNGSDRKRGDQESVKSTQAKKDFVKIWNVVGPRYGHQAFEYQDI